MTEKQIDILNYKNKDCKKYLFWESIKYSLSQISEVPQNNAR